MRVGDIVETVTVPTVMQLETICRLRERLDVDLLESADARVTPEPSDGTPQAELRRILRDYVLDEPNGNGGGTNGDGSTAAALRTALESACGRAEHAGTAAGSGAGLLIDGVHGSGKTHFLSVLALLLEYEAARSIFAETHPEFRDVLDEVGSLQPVLVVPISLDAHRGRSELLEDIVFDAPESEFARPKYGIHLPLSAESHALHLIDEYIATRYRHELDAYVRRESLADGGPVPLAGAPRAAGLEGPRPDTQTSLSFSEGEWARLRRADPRRALQTARQFLSEINYPLDFRQSRVQRLDRLTHAVRSNHLAGVVWLVDELGLFLRSAEPKGLANDCGFLQFLGQRAQDDPLWFIGTMRRSVETMSDLSPHAVQQVRERYKTGLSLSSSNVRAVLRRRVVRRRDPATFDRVIASLYERLKQRFPQLTFTQEQMAAAYPLHPMTMDCLEAAAGRFLSRARSAIDFVQARVAGDPGRALAGILDQHVSTLVTPDVLFDHFAGQMAQSAVPVGAFVGEVHEYFQRNVATLLPRQAGLGMRTVKTLLMLRATNQEASVRRVAECVMLSEPVTDESPYAAARALLQQLSERTPYVRLRKREPLRQLSEDDLEDIYFIGIPPQAEDGLQHRVATAKSVLADDDPRIVEHALRACCTPIFPISNFRTPSPDRLGDAGGSPKVVELEWRNTHRHAAVVQTNISALSTAQLADAMQRLSDPDTRESCEVFIGVPFRAEEQIRHWRSICKDLPSGRWRSALIAWVPRPLEAGELLRLKEYAAVRMVHDAGTGSPRAARRVRPPDESDADAPDSRDVEALMRELYAEGTLVTAKATRPDAPPPSLTAIKDDWGTLLRYVSGVAFEDVFPRFTHVMPTARVASQRQVDGLIAEVIFGDLALESIAPRLRALVRTHVAPMGLAAERDGRFALSASASPVATELCGIITRRDTTKRDERGRPMALELLLRLMTKSPLGLPPTMSRLAVAVLARLGYLQALSASRQPLQLCTTPHPRVQPEGEAEESDAAAVEDPFRAAAYIARAPLLAHHEWQQAGAVARGLLRMPLAPPDWPVQQALWERLVTAREQWGIRMQDLRTQLDELRGALGHRREQWPESYEAIRTVSAVLEGIDPSLPTADGLRRLIATCTGLSGASRPLGDRPLAPALAQVVARIEAVEKFVTDYADAVVRVYEYLSRIELPAKATVQTAHQERLLGLIDGGEALVGRAAMLEMMWRSFHAAYARAYVAWHDRCHKAADFQRYQQLRAMTGYRALQQLSKLSLPTRVTLKDIDKTIDEQHAKQCSSDRLGENLHSSPVCPKCELPLGASLELVPPARVAELIQMALTQHIQGLQQPHVRRALTEYADSCPTAELGNRIKALTELAPDTAPPRLLATLSNELIGHVRRAIGGRRIHTRRLEALREQFAGKLLTKGELAETLQRWLDEGDDLAQDELVHVE